MYHVISIELPLLFPSLTLPLSFTTSILLPSPLSLPFPPLPLSPFPFLSSFPPSLLHFFTPLSLSLSPTLPPSLLPFHPPSFPYSFLPFSFQVEKGEEKDFDMCMCSVAMFPKIKHLQKILKAKMPNPRRGKCVSLLPIV